MPKSMKECFSGHVLMHSLFGLGLGIVLATAITGLQNIWYGVVAMAVAVVFDMMRKQ